MCSAGPVFPSAGWELFLKLNQRRIILVSFQEVRAGAVEQAADRGHPWRVSNGEVQGAAVVQAVAVVAVQAAVQAVAVVAVQAAVQGAIMRVSAIVLSAVGSFRTKPGYPVQATSARIVVHHL